MNFFVDDDIRKAETLPSSFYRHQSVFEELKHKVFLKNWLWIGDQSMLAGSIKQRPITFLENFIDEPILLSVDKDHELKCLSNICTHRANILVHHPDSKSKITCGYHGRRFDLGGKMEFMPEFEEVENFPRECDHLKVFPLINWQGHFFVGLSPNGDFNKILNKMEERIGFLPLEQFKHDSKYSKEYIVGAHWALYCDNYLEGFHIPFVHPDLNQALDYGEYKTEIYDHLTLQIGYSDTSKDCFVLPPNHPDYGKNVAAFYYWIFPNMMFNFYPWGLSINIVKPISTNKTKVQFISYVYDESKINEGAGSQIDKVEREDEFVVENVHRGLQSTFYERGRFSVKREKGVHYFQWLLAKYLNEK